MTRLACGESIADLWGYPDATVPSRPTTPELFKAISAEAEICLVRADWEIRIKRIENILSVIKGRMNRHWEEWLDSEMDKLINAEVKAV